MRICPSRFEGEGSGAPPPSPERSGQRRGLEDLSSRRHVGAFPDLDHEQALAATAVGAVEIIGGALRTRLDEVPRRPGTEDESRDDVLAAPERDQHELSPSGRRQGLLWQRTESGREERRRHVVRQYDVCEDGHEGRPDGIRDHGQRVVDAGHTTRDVLDLGPTEPQERGDVEHLAARDQKAGEPAPESDTEIVAKKLRVRDCRRRVHGGSSWRFTSETYPGPFRENVARI